MLCSYPLMGAIQPIGAELGRVTVTALAAIGMFATLQW